MAFDKIHSIWINKRLCVWSLIDITSCGKDRISWCRFDVIKFSSIDRTFSFVSSLLWSHRNLIRLQTLSDRPTDVNSEFIRILLHIAKFRYYLSSSTHFVNCEVKYSECSSQRRISSKWSDFSHIQLTFKHNFSIKLQTWNFKQMLQLFHFLLFVVTRPFFSHLPREMF